MSESGAPISEPVEIGARVRMVRRRRGLGLETAAGLAGISKSYLSLLENGKRQFDRRGLVEDIARALGCSPADITGSSHAPVDRRGPGAEDALHDIRSVLNDYAADEIPDVHPRTVNQLASWADQANESCSQAEYSTIAHEAATALAELQKQAFTANRVEREEAFTAAVTTCSVTGVVASRLGNVDLAATAARRGFDLAYQYDDLGLRGFARWYWAMELISSAARKRARSVLNTGIAELAPSVNLTRSRTLPAEMTGMLHLQLARTAARQDDSDQAHAHLAEARQLADRIGERNGMRQHFGPTNVAAWRLAIGIELSEGRRAYDDTMNAKLDVNALASRERSSSLHFDLARALTQESATTDAEAIRHLDQADRLAPQRIRSDPLARDLTLELNRRATRTSWELTSLRNRFGIG